jgi:hypothetical protein
MIQKREIKRQTRQVFLIVAGLLCATSLGNFLLTCRTVYVKPSMVESCIDTYRYSHKGDMNYQVYLKPNSIFAKTIVGPGQTYFSKLVDYMHLVYTYQFSADSLTALKGSYIITATVEAKDSWQKEFILVPLTSFVSEGKQFSFTKNYPLQLNQFLDFLKKVNDEIGVTARDPRLIIKATTYIKGVTASGTIQDTIVPTMVIPLNTGSFQVEGALTEDSEGSLYQTTQVTAPGLEQKKARLFSWLIITVLLGLLFLLLLLFTKGKLIKIDEQALIQKKYGSRMIPLPDDRHLFSGVTVISLSSIDNLVRVADELAKPIFKVVTQEKLLVSYYVFDCRVVYQYALRGRENPELF